MFKKFIYIFFFFPALAFSTSGERLINKFWTNTVAKDFTKIAHTISNHFEGTSSTYSFNQDENVTMTKAQLLQYLEGLNLTGFTISNLQTTKNEHNLVITYDIHLDIPVKGLYNYTYHEIFIYERKDDHWKLIASSFFPYNAPG